MINIGNGWAIGTEDYYYTLGVVKTDKNGKAYLEHKTYHITIGHAIEHYYKCKAYDIIAEQDMTLQDALAKLQTLTYEITNLRYSIERMEYNGGTDDD